MSCMVLFVSQRGHYLHHAKVDTIATTRKDQVVRVSANLTTSVVSSNDECPVISPWFCASATLRRSAPQMPHFRDFAPDMLSTPRTKGMKRQYYKDAMDVLVRVSYRPGFRSTCHLEHSVETALLSA